MQTIKHGKQDQYEQTHLLYLSTIMCIEIIFSQQYLLQCKHTSKNILAVNQSQLLFGHFFFFINYTIELRMHFATQICTSLTRIKVSFHNSHLHNTWNILKNEPLNVAASIHCFNTPQHNIFLCKKCDSETKANITKQLKHIFNIQNR